MNYDQLKVIDFSQGIRSSEVMSNDLALQGQIERERLSIAGSGVNYGLELKLTNDFELTVTDGTITNDLGEEQFIKGNVFEIEKPKLIQKSGYIESYNNGMIKLKYIPYSTNRKMPAQYGSIEDRGIELSYYDDNHTSISISSIKRNILYTNATDNKKIYIKYQTAYDRIDTVYIDNNQTIKVVSGVNSTTPSAYIPKDCTYVLGFIKIIKDYYDESVDYLFAKASLIKEFNNRRTVYTDSNNNLYLCGVPFESLLKIYFEEPKEPKEGMLLYDMTTNKLKIWRRTDNFNFVDILQYDRYSNPTRTFSTSVGYKKNQIKVYVKQTVNSNGTIKSAWVLLQSKYLKLMTDLSEEDKESKESKEFMITTEIQDKTEIKYVIDRYDDSYYWVPINDTSYIAVNECKMWAPNKEGDNLVEYKNGLNIDEMTIDRESHDLKTFLFKKDELHLRFTPYKNELNIMIDQIPLYKDQFVEITVNDILKDANLKEMAINYYGYTDEYLNSLKSDYKEIGLGFKLVNKLDRPGFIEVSIQHRINDSVLKNKFQRNATFAKSETLNYMTDVKAINGVVTIQTSIPFQYGEEQLDVYINGVKIKNDLITEISSGTENVLGAFCKSFSFKTKDVNISEKSEITYKILTNVYSYDHVDSRMKESHEDLQNQIDFLSSRIETIEQELFILEGLLKSES